MSVPMGFLPKEDEYLYPSATTQEFVELQYRLPMDHAWRWFHMHAGQRLRLLNFFFLSMAVLAAGYTNAIESKSENGIATAVALFAVFISLSFFVAERRTDHLVDAGRDALNEIETKLYCVTGIAKIRIIAHIEECQWKWYRIPFTPMSYRFIIPLVELTSTVLWIAAAVYSGTRPD